MAVALAARNRFDVELIGRAPQVRLVDVGREVQLVAETAEDLLPAESYSVAKSGLRLAFPIKMMPPTGTRVAGGRTTSSESCGV